MRNNNRERERDLEQSLGLNFSRFNSIGWSNPNFYEASQDRSVLCPMPAVQGHHHLVLLMSEPPYPATPLFRCIENENSQQEEIKQVSYLPDNEPETRRVNHKQYFRIMKRRIKKVLNKYQEGTVTIPKPTQQHSHRKYIYQSRHQHAKKRLRGKDGKFVATRTPEERFRQKKKRGRKPKNPTITGDPTTSSPKLFTPVKSIFS